MISSLLNLTKAKSIDQNVIKNCQTKLYLSIAIFYKFDIATAIPCREINKHEKNQKAFHKNIWLPNECLR